MTIVQVVLILFIFHRALRIPGEPVRVHDRSRRPWR
jgi:hypothetical protein